MKRIGSFLAVAFCIAAMSTAASAATCNSNNSGAWNTAGNWSCGHVPNAADDVVIATTHAMTYNPGTGTILSLTINGTGSLRFNDNSSDTLNVTGSVTNNGTIFGGDGPGNRNHTLVVGGNFTNNGTFTAVVGNDDLSVTLNGSVAQTIGGSSATAFLNLTINNAAGVTLNTTTDVGGSVTGVLTLTTDLTIDVANSEILIQSGTSAGAGDVLGTVRRTDVGATTRAFGNPNVQITNGGSATVDVNCAKGVPGGFAAAVARGYSIIPATGTGAGATVRLRYLQGELNGNSEAGLTLWRATGSPTALWFDQGFTTRDATNNWVELTGVTGFSQWTFAAVPSAPTAVKLTSFTAIQNNGEVMLQWRTGYETHNLGYVVYREQNGRRVAITPSLIAGSALLAGRNTQLTSGLTYTWYDRVAEIRGPKAESKQKTDPAVTYWLEDVDLNGTRTLHGPIAALPVVAPLPAKGGKQQRADLIGELSLKAIADARLGSDVGRGSNGFAGNGSSIRTPVSGIEFRRWPAAFAGQVAAQRIASNPGVQSNALRSAALTSGKGGKPKVSFDPGAVQRQIESQPGIKLAVSHEGWYRVTQPELVAAGYDPNTNAPQLQLYRNGRAVPIKQSGDQVHLTSSDYIEFYGQGLESPTETSQTYYLVVDPNQFGTRIGDLTYRDPQPLPPPSGATSFDYTVERKERMIYFSSLRNGDTENFFGQVVSTTPTIETMPVSNLDPTVVGTLEVVLQGVTAGAHLVQISFNGVDVGTMNFSDTEHTTGSFSVPAGALQAGNNTVELTSLGGAADVSLVDTVRLTYGHTYAADNNALGVNVAAPETKRIAGFTSNNIRVMDITDPARVLELTETAQVNAEANGTYSVDVQVQDASPRQPHALFVFTDSAALPVASVKHNDASSWWAQTAGADYLMITTRELKASVEPLAQLRRNQGQVVHVIDVEDVYDEFSFGQHTPQAIHDLLATAQNTWARKPYFVLLAGDASYDPKNYFGQGMNDLVPTKLIDTALMEASSDDWLADFDGDGLADLALGRLPARSAVDLNLMVGKIISYENAAPDPSRGALLVADTSFEAPSSAVESLLPPGLAVTTVNRVSMNDAAARAQILAGLHQGPRIVNYFGHGSNGVWTGASLLSSDDAPGLTNTNRLSVYTLMTCFNGFFQDAWNDSLSEALLKSQGGAVAVWASTTLTDPSGQNVIDLEFYRQVFAAQPATLGDASRAAKGTTGDVDVRRTWTLFGDPAMKLR